VLKRFQYLYVEYNYTKEPKCDAGHESARISYHDCFVPDNFWRCGAVHSTVHGYYAITKSWWVLTVCLPYIADCKHITDTLLVRLLLIVVVYKRWFSWLLITYITQSRTWPQKTAPISDAFLCQLHCFITENWNHENEITVPYLCDRYTRCFIVYCCLVPMPDCVSLLLGCHLTDFQPYSPVFVWSLKHSDG